MCSGLDGYISGGVESRARKDALIAAVHMMVLGAGYRGRGRVSGMGGEMGKGTEKCDLFVVLS